ncbi:MAG: dihydrodipicolinate synthase family protein [Arenibacterium sp.]
MLTEAAKGVFTISVTPVREDGSLDLDSLDRVTDFYIEQGATGLTVLGMMGEAGKLSADEAVRVVRRVTARTSVPVVVGVSAPGFAAMHALANDSMNAGAAGVMVAPPSTLRTDAQIVSYYRNTTETLGRIPFVLQDFPLATQVVISTSVIREIVRECPTCVMLKHEDWPGLDKISALRAASDRGERRISILCENGALYLLEEMQRGAVGAMTGFSYPEMMARTIVRYNTGDVTGARDVFDAYLPLIRYEAQPGLGLAIRKHVLARRGAIASPAVRKPGGLLNAAAVREVESLIHRQAQKLRALGLEPN